MRIRTTRDMDFVDGFSAPAGTLLIPINGEWESVDSMSEAMLNIRDPIRYRVMFDGDTTAWRYVGDDDWIDEDNAVWIEAEFKSRYLMDYRISNA